jgi:RNA methyltransferase, TrmH family
MITSIQNPRVQQVRTLLREAKERKATGLCVVEGVRLVEEAMQSGLTASFVFFVPDLSERGMALIQSCQIKGVETLEISVDLLQRVSDTEQPQGILAVFPIPSPTISASTDFVIIADNIRDPGNLGTILRTAAAAGARAVWLSPGCADAWSPKVLRSGMGAHFHLTVQSMSWEDIRAQADRLKLKLFLADSGGGSTLWHADLTGPVGLIICNEADGPSAQARELDAGCVTIPMPGKFESLNASTAAAILIYEIVRQRTTR